MEIPLEVAILLSTCTVDARGAGFGVVLVGKLDRKDYQRCNDVLVALGGKWNRKLKCHLFDADPREALARAVDGQWVETDADVGFFATPEPLARRLVAMADVRDGDWVLEPSAGEGAIVRALQEKTATVVMCEWDAGRRAVLRELSKRVVVMGVEVATVLDEPDFMNVTSDGFLMHAVVMNPPFAKVGLGDHLDHVRHAYGLLRPGGKLVSVLPSGVSFRQDKRHREFRDWALDGGEVVPLPEHSFRESGTDVNTVVLVKEKTP